MSSSANSVLGNSGYFKANPIHVILVIVIVGRCPNLGLGFIGRDVFHPICLDRHRASFDKLRVRAFLCGIPSRAQAIGDVWWIVAVQNEPHPELVEGRTMPSPFPTNAKAW